MATANRVNVDGIYKAIRNVDGASTRQGTMDENGQGEAGTLNVDWIYKAIPWIYKAIPNVEGASTRQATMHVQVYGCNRIFDIGGEYPGLGIVLGGKQVCAPPARPLLWLVGLHRGDIINR